MIKIYPLGSENNYVIYHTQSQFLGSRKPNFGLLVTLGKVDLGLRGFSYPLFALCFYPWMPMGGREREDHVSFGEYPKE